MYETFLGSENNINGWFLPDEKLEYKRLVDTYLPDGGMFIEIGSFEGMSNDLKAWIPKLKRTGIIGGHDYATYWPGV